MAVGTQWGNPEGDPQVGYSLGIQDGGEFLCDICDIVPAILDSWESPTVGAPPWVIQKPS